MRLSTILGRVLLTILSLATAAPSAMAADPIVRGLYWNFRYEDTYDDIKQTLNTIRSLGVTRVHFWMNEPPVPKTALKCDGVFGFADLAGHANWTPATARRFIKDLSDAGMKVVLTVSPYVPTQAYVDSLFGPDGPVSIANEFLNVDIELDIEGNWTDSYVPAGCSKLIPAKDAKAAFVTALRNKAPKVGLGISTDRWDLHADIIKVADWVAPQLYNPGSFLQDFKRVRSFGRPVWPALWVEKSDEAGFDGLLRTIDQLRACDPAFVNGYVIWGRRELKKAAYSRPYLSSHMPTDRQSCAGN